MVTRKKPPRTIVGLSEFNAMRSRAETAEARCARLRTLLRAVLATLPNEFTSAETQAVRREARAAVEET